MIRNLANYFLTRRWYVRSKSLKGYSRVLAAFIQVSDILLLVLINLLAWRIYRRIDPDWAPTLTFSLVLFYLVQFVVWFSLLQVANLPKIPRTTRTIVLVFNVLRISFIGLITLFVFKYLFGVWQVTPTLIFLFSALAAVTYSFAHIVSVRLFKIYRSNGYDIHKVLVFADTYSEDFIRKIMEQKEWGFEIVAIISDSRIIKNKFENIVPVYSSRKDPVELIKKHVVDEVIYSRFRFAEEEFRKVILYCFKTGIIFRMQSELSPVNDVKIRLEQLHKMPDLVFLNVPGDNIALMFKSFIDHAVSLALVLISLPVFAVIAIAIKLDSPGPVFFLQKRVGLRGREFKLIKFRTMVKNAEELRKLIEKQNEMDGPVFKVKNDPRVTRVGKFLRETGLDELPQLFNVIKGEMSLVGPRPPLPSEVKQYPDQYLRRLSVKPGITCTWQVVPNRNSVRFERWMQLDMEYIDKWSLKLDFLIFLKTFRTVILRTGL